MRNTLLSCLAAALLFCSFDAARPAWAAQASAADALSGKPSADRPAAVKPLADNGPRVTGAKVLAVGLFSSTVESRSLTPQVADGIRDQARDFILIKRGAAQEARLETGIGLRYQLTGEPRGAEVLVDVVVRHPAMVNPDTQLPMTHSTAQYGRSIGAVEHNVWSFDTPAGLVPGEYVIEVLHKGRVLARQVFQVTVKP